MSLAALANIDVWALSTHDLCRLRWEAGRREHRPNGGGFVGDRHLEALSEGADGVNFATLCLQEGDDPYTCQQMREAFRDAIAAARTLYSLRKSAELAGRFAPLLDE
jgi:hypothetical protein